MIKSTNILRVICGSCALFLIILASSPLVLLAFSPTATTVNKARAVISESSNSPPKPLRPEAVYLDSQNNTIDNSDIPLYDMLTVSERLENNMPTVLPVFEYNYINKSVYLTFDDGPDPVNTPQILDILKENDIKATFFVVGTSCERCPNILKRIYEDGHAVGNHSYNHNYSDLYRSTDNYAEQMYKNDNIIKSIIGVRPRITRAPGGTAGSFTKAYWERLKKDGYVDIGWNISSGDAAKPNVSAAEIESNVARQMQNKALWTHSIVLMHDGAGHSETVKALPKIIKMYKENGFQFRVANVMTPPAW